MKSKKITVWLILLSTLSSLAGCGVKIAQNESQDNGSQVIYEDTESTLDNGKNEVNIENENSNGASEENEKKKTSLSQLWENTFLGEQFELEREYLIYDFYDEFGSPEVITSKGDRYYIFDTKGNLLDGENPLYDSFEKHPKGRSDFAEDIIYAIDLSNKQYSEEELLAINFYYGNAFDKSKYVIEDDIVEELVLYPYEKNKVDERVLGGLSYDEVVEKLGCPGRVESIWPNFQVTVSWETSEGQGILIDFSTSGQMEMKSTDEYCIFNEDRTLR